MAGMTHAPLLFCDTETTSLVNPWRPKGRRVWEATFKRVEAGQVVSQGAYLVGDVDLQHANPDSLAIGGFHDRHPHGRGPGFVPADQVITEAQLAALVWEVTRIGSDRDGWVHLVASNPHLRARELRQPAVPARLPRGPVVPPWDLHHHPGGRRDRDPAAVVVLGAVRGGRRGPGRVRHRAHLERGH